MSKSGLATDSRARCIVEPYHGIDTIKLEGIAQVIESGLLR